MIFSAEQKAIIELAHGDDEHPDDPPTGRKYGGDEDDKACTKKHLVLHPKESDSDDDSIVSPSRQKRLIIRCEDSDSDDDSVVSPLRPKRLFIRGEDSDSECEEVLKLKIIRVTAAAGSGKTTTVIGFSKRLIQMGRTNITYLTYSKALAKDAERRMDKHVTCQTIHSFQPLT